MKQGFDVHEHLKVLLALRDEGIRVEIGDELIESTRWLAIVSDGPASLAFDLPGGRAGYVFDVRLTALVPMTLDNLEISSAWDDQISLMDSASGTSASSSVAPVFRRRKC